MTLAMSILAAKVKHHFCCNSNCNKSGEYQIFMDMEWHLGSSSSAHPQILPRHLRMQCNDTIVRIFLFSKKDYTND